MQNLSGTRPDVHLRVACQPLVTTVILLTPLALTATNLPSCKPGAYLNKYVRKHLDRGGMMLTCVLVAATLTS
jgi:hypothetical protein